MCLCIKCGKTCIYYVYIAFLLQQHLNFVLCMLLSKHKSKAPVFSCNNLNNRILCTKWSCAINKIVCFLPSTVFEKGIEMSCELWCMYIFRPMVEWVNFLFPERNNVMAYRLSDTIYVYLLDKTYQFFFLVQKQFRYTGDIIFLLFSIIIKFIETEAALKTKKREDSFMLV